MTDQFANLSREELIALVLDERARAEEAEAALVAAVASAVRTLRDRWVGNPLNACTEQDPDSAAVRAVGAVVDMLVKANEHMHRLRGPLQVAGQHNRQVCAAGRACGDSVAPGPPGWLGECRVGGGADDRSVLRRACGRTGGGAASGGCVSYLTSGVQDLLIEFHFLLGLMTCGF